MEFLILGRLGVLEGDRDLTPPRSKQRALLALLLLRAGELVTTDEAAEALWEGRPPPSARNAIQGHVAALRRLLGRERIDTRDTGYVFRLDEGELDLHRFERVLTDARGRPPQDQAELLSDGLSLFRGAPLEDFRYHSFAASEAARISELRLQARELRIDAELALGRHEGLVPELEQLVDESPLRERLRSQLMLALYRCGRQAEALAAYQQARQILVDELGIEPAPALQRLERQILNQDPELELYRPGPAHRIPSPATPLLGRERELEETGELLLRRDVRVVTLTGPGGVGKTRLALELARQTAPGFAGGSFFVDVAALTDPDLVLPAVAHTLEVREGGGAPLGEALAARIGDRSTLVAIDNVEHLAGCAPSLGSLVAAAPGLTLLFTSREPTRLYGEHLVRVPPLDDDAAVTLFLDRAAALRPDIDRGGPTRETVGAICRRLDCLPLAIELAAGRMELLSADLVLARLEERLDLLGPGPADRPARQQTLRATLEWSHERLEPAEQQLFAQLAVFAGGWTLEAADTVCGAGTDVVERVSSLVDKSLLHVLPGGSEPRQGMLVTIRDFAIERLEKSGTAEAVRSRHAAYFLELAETAAPHLRGSPKEWLDRLAVEQDNVRAALDRFEATGETHLAQRLAGALWRYWYLAGHLAEGEERLERVLDADPGPTPARARALLGAAVMQANTAGGEPAKRRAEEALALHRELGDAWGTAYSEFMLGHYAADRAEARRLYEGSIQVFRELGDEHSDLLATRHLASAYDELGDPERARALRAENLARARSTGNRRIEASTLGALADDAMTDGRDADAASLARESLAIHSELGDVLDTAVDLCRFAAAAASAGDAAIATIAVASFEAAGDMVGGGRRAWAAELNEQTLAAVHAQLEDAAFDEAWRRGLGLTMADAVALALRSGE